MTHDPYQTHAMFGAYSGLTNPFSSINPAVAGNPLAANAGVPWGVPQGYGIPTYGGISPQMFGLSPFSSGWQNPFINPTLQNPLAQTGLQNPLLNPLLTGQQIGLQGYNPYSQAGFGHQGSGFGQQQQISPFAQFNNPYAQQGNPFAQQGNPYAQQGNPYAQQGNPFAQQGNPYAQQGNPFVQQGNPFVQQGNPFAQQSLAPQSWVGQGQVGQLGQIGGVQGQVNPLLVQAVVRAIQQTQGIAPWAAF